MLATVVKPSTTLTSFSRNAATSRLDNNNNGRGLSPTAASTAVIDHKDC